MSLSNCSPFFNCDNANMTWDQVLRELVTVTANGCPALRIYQPDDIVEDQLLHGVTGNITTTATTDLLAAPSAGLRYYIDSILVTNSHPSVGTWVNIKDESGATLITGYAAANGGGFTNTYPKGLQQPVHAQKLQVVCETTGSNVRVSVNAAVKA